MSSTNKSIRSSSSSILRRGRGGKTKAARKKFAQAQKLQDIDKSVRWQEDEDTTISTKNSTKNRRRRRRRPKEILTPEEDTTSLISSQTSSNAVAIVEEEISREKHYSQNDDGDSLLSSDHPANLGDEEESSSSSSRTRQNCHNSSSARSSLSSLSTNDDSYCSSLHQNNNNSRSSDISANTTTSLDKKRSSSTSSLRRQKRRLGNSRARLRESLSSRSTLVRNDDDDDKCFSSSPSHSSNDPTTAVKGAGANVFAVQDAGSYHMLRDDCLYLCSSGKEESLWELAWLLSEKKNRFLLWTHDISSNTQQTTISPTKKQPHQSMHVCNAILQLFSDYYNHTTKSNDDDNDDASCYSSRSMNHNDDDSSSITSSVASVSSSTKKPPDPTQRGRRSRRQTKESPSLYNHNAVAALSTILCFLSWDCTTTNSISACEHDRKFMARQIRATILQHSKAFCGIVQLLLLLQPEQPSENQTRQQDLITASQPKGTEEEDQNQDNQSNEEPSKAKFIDPTSLGRRRRKRKRGNQQKRTSTVPLLSPVIEDKASCTNSDEVLSQDNSKAIFHFQSASSCEEEKDLTSDRKKNTTTITDSTPLQNTSTDLSAVARKVCQKIPRLSWKDKQAGVETIEEEGESIPNCFRWIALESIARIIQGKASDEEASSSCYVLEEEEEGENDDNDDNDSTQSPTNETAMNHSYSTIQNPLLVTNQWLYQSGALTILSTAMSQTLQFSQDHRMISTLATLLDGACLFSNGNRQELCETGELIPSLLRCLVQLLLLPQKNNGSEAGDTEKKDTIGDKTTPTTTVSLEIILLCLRTLTSLTHENDLAGQQLQQEVILDGDGIEEKQSKTLSGSDILLQFLYQMVQWTNCDNDDATVQPSTAAAGGDTYPSMVTPKNNTNQQQHPLQYDCIVFCLNTLTNIVESANLFDIISTYRVPDGDNSFYLAWLTQWIIGETASFRDLLLEGKKSIKGGSNPSLIDDEKGEETNHKNHSSAGQKDEEHLVTSGNGFIFLACLMTTASSWTCKRQKEQTSRMILDDLKPYGGYDLMMNTLRSFCNLYYYSLGSDLSMAVVAPVKELLEKLSVLRKKEWA